MSTDEKTKAVLYNESLDYTGNLIEYGKAEERLQKDDTFNSFEEKDQRAILFDISNYYSKPEHEEL